MDFGSMSVLWFGASKIWYAIPASNAEKFEKLVAENIDSTHSPKCNAPLRHKTNLFNPDFVKSKGIIVNRVNI